MLRQFPRRVPPSALQLRVSWHICPQRFCRGNFEQSHLNILKTRDCHVDRASIFRCVGHANLREQSPKSFISQKTAHLPTHSLTRIPHLIFMFLLKMKSLLLTLTKNCIIFASETLSLNLKGLSCATDHLVHQRCLQVVLYVAQMCEILISSLIRTAQQRHAVCFSDASWAIASYRWVSQLLLSIFQMPPDFPGSYNHTRYGTHRGCHAKVVTWKSFTHDCKVCYESLRATKQSAKLRNVLNCERRALVTLLVSSRKRCWNLSIVSQLFWAHQPVRQCGVSSKTTDDG